MCVCVCVRARACVCVIFVSTSHLTGLDTRLMTRKSIIVEVRGGEGQA